MIRWSWPTISCRFGRDERGVAATEFAIIVPIFVALYLGTVLGSDALSASRRATLAANTLSDLVAQEAVVNKADLTGMFDAASLITDPGTDNLIFRVISVGYNDETQDAEVLWSYDSEGKIPYATGASYTGINKNFVKDSPLAVVVVESQMVYDPAITGTAFDKMTFRDVGVRWPRKALRVEFCKDDTGC